jgi:hypothetical protein
MDMKRILQAMDGVTSKPAEGVDSMAKFLRTVTEAEINPPTAQIPAMPDITGLQAGQPKDMGDGSKVTVNADGTVSYQGGWGTYVYNAQGQHIKTQSPSMAGYSQETDPTGAVIQQNYNQGPMNIQKGPQGTTANYQLGADKLQTSVQEGIDKFLSIVKKNDVSILNEGVNPHKVSLPVQMAMQHYQQTKSATGSEPGLLKKYFHEVESEINEQAQTKRQLVNQYASVIAERVMKKQSKNKVLNEDESDDESERSRFPHYYKHKERTIFRIPDEANPNGYRDIQPEDDEWDSIYQQEFDMPSPKEKGGFYIGNHPLVKGPDDQDQDVGEMAIAHNPADANNPMIHGHEKANAMHLKDRIAQARAQLKELAQLADSNELVVWEKITRLSKGGMFMGLEQNLEQIRHGISELVQARKTGKQFPPKARGDIDKHIG